MQRRKRNSYGMPYQGSKNRVIAWLCQNLPGGDTFVDLFCGGCSVTHYMMTQGRYRHYIINDINPMLPRTFLGAIHGLFHDERRWISREQFFELKGSDPYVSICFSFGNNMSDYLYNKDLEPYKRACHYAVVFNVWSELQGLCPEVWQAAKQALDEITPIGYRYIHQEGYVFPMDIVTPRRKRFGRAIVDELKRIKSLSVIDSNLLYHSLHLNTSDNMASRPMYVVPSNIKRLERLQSLESNPLYQSCKRKYQSHGNISLLECLGAFERFVNLEGISSDIACHSGDYQSVDIPEGAVVYCDIPYKGTGKYQFNDETRAFDHDRFYSWALSRNFPVFVSEYDMPEGFTCIAAVTRASSMSSVTTIKKIERLYVQDRFAARYSRDLFMR